MLRDEINDILLKVAQKGMERRPILMGKSTDSILALMRKLVEKHRILKWYGDPDVLIRNNKLVDDLLSELR